MSGLILFLLSGVVAGNARADVFRPAYLELREAGPGRYDVLWKVPAMDPGSRADRVVFPAGTVRLAEPASAFRDGASIERWRVGRDGGWVGTEIRLERMATGVTDILVRIERADGTSQVERLAPEGARFTVEAPAGAGQVAWSYLVLGFEHILAGADHLLFVFAIMLITGPGWRLLKTVTAFTAAHSLTLTAATLGLARVPSKPAEAVIALSIVFVAAEILHARQGRPRLTARWPWVAAFGFGLLHGFGFAGALREVGLPARHIPLALLQFNVGVELGQLLFVGVVLAVGAVARRSLGVIPEWVGLVPPYAIGGIAMAWVIERVLSF